MKKQGLDVWWHSQAELLNIALLINTIRILIFLVKCSFIHIRDAVFI